MGGWAGRPYQGGRKQVQECVRASQLLPCLPLECLPPFLTHPLAHSLRSCAWLNTSTHQANLMQTKTSTHLFHYVPDPK